MKLSVTDVLTPDMVALHHSSVKCEGERHGTPPQ